ncbi:elongation factor P hydroxylase [Marinobacter sp. ATCH36]|uniref:elongation factor P hydroxylase n=1 Tax=Marinobacter sp. ATCH36 TaxID=2945106 RepID=UPI00202055B3|nr:elongation factor P hydroxylase [Marinobacter sp. ATCH36]MCL7945815.1 elongation factor P hydroxylase [Marinobacter sp. ATCH36]
MRHDPDDLIMLFNGLFREKYRTVLVRGGDEPEYLPAAEPDSFAQIIFARGYYASALHEISHWCIAGEYRRTLCDFGYWYCPDGRSVEQQQAFEKAEVKPQALEWLFSVAAGTRFHVSVDNLSGNGAWDEDAFRRNVTAQANDYLKLGLPYRAGLLLQTLRNFYGTAADFNEVWKKETRRLMPECSATDTEVT